MEKYIISLNLSKSLLEQIDRDAQLTRRNRSQVVNDILSAHYDLETPGQRLDRIMASVSDAMASLQPFDLIPGFPGNTLQLRTSVAYRYNPKLRYVLALDGRNGDINAQLRIYSRTTSEAFLEALVEFFKQLAAYEKRHPFPFRLVTFVHDSFQWDGSRFSRDLLCSRADAYGYTDAVSRELAAYMEHVELCMRRYFANPEQPMYPTET